MPRAISSFPAPLGPRISTAASERATAGRIARTRRIASLRETMPATSMDSSAGFRVERAACTSRNDSTPPRKEPSRSLSRPVARP
jgi:hypothetical protein